MKNFTIAIKSLFFLFTLFYFQNISAQAPNKMSYQAVVRNASNVLVSNTNVGIQISILQTTATGTAVYVERHAVPTNLNGLATLEIGGGTLVSGNFATINWANGPYFVKTETDPTGGTNYTISGTSQLLSVPFALFAKETANAWKTSGNAIGTSDFFLGSTDDNDVVFKRNNQEAGRISFINTSFGRGTLANGAASTFNTAMGLRTMGSTTTGGSNTAYGADALGGNVTGGFNTAIGRNSLISNFSGSNNVAVGMSAMQNTTGSDNVAIGRGALSSSNGSNNIAIGKDATVSNVSNSNQIRMGNTLATLATIQVAWSVSSDKRWKENVKPSDLGLNFINYLKPVSYTRINDKSKKTEYGFIAQELDESLKHFGAQNNGIISTDDEGTLSVRYNDLIAPMVKAIQEQQSIIDAQSKKIDALLKRLEKLESK